MNKKHFFLLLALTLIGAILRFYKIDWGQGFFFHPDERNIASAVLNLEPARGDFNPNFFAYGSFPIYVTYAIGAILSFLTKTNWLEFGKVILIGRAVSATLSTLLIPLVYLVTKEAQVACHPESRQRRDEGSSCITQSHRRRFIVGILPARLALRLAWRARRYSQDDIWVLAAAVLTTFSVGLIQYAHFSTFEIILTFEYLLALYFALKIAKHGHWRDYILCAVVIGTSIATKVTSLLIAPILPLGHLYFDLLQNRCDRDNFVAKIPLRIKQNFLQFLCDRRKIVTSLLLTILTAIVLSPYNILDFSSFRGAMDYEGGVATGNLPVFYTAQFIGTTPIWYQLAQVLPYILGWPLTIVGFFAFFFLLLSNLRNLSNLLLFLIPALYSGCHAALFVKWTRYMVPMLPFLIIFSVKLVKSLMNHARRFKVFLLFAVCCLLFAVVVQGLSFFSIYLRPDTRVAAAKWASKNIPRDARILSEVWDMGLIAFNPYFDNIKLFDFYQLDENGNLKVDELAQRLEQSDYIIVPSRRIYGTRLRLLERFPIGARYYQALFDESLGFTKIAEFNSLSEAKAEETFKVFDHPKVMIFRKVKPLTKVQYQYILLR